MREWLRRLLCRLGLCREPELHYIGGSDTLPPPLSRERETELLNRLGEEAARQELIEHNLRLVVYIARRFENTGINIEDLISIGTIGLIKAVGTYRTDKNIKLATYASRCIENEILMFLRKNAGRRVEVSFDEPLNTDYDGNELLLSDVLGTEADVVMRPLEDDVDLCLLASALDTLSPREREIITLRFGLGGGKEQTQKEVADRLGIEPGSNVVYISRLRLADGEPVQVEKSYFPLKYAFLLEEDLNNGSMFECLKEKAGAKVASSEKMIELCRATAEEAALMDVKKGDYLLFVKSTAYDENGEPMYAGIQLINGDRFALYVYESGK